MLLPCILSPRSVQINTTICCLVPYQLAPLTGERCRQLSSRHLLEQCHDGFRELLHDSVSQRSDGTTELLLLVGAIPIILLLQFN